VPAPYLTYESGAVHILWCTAPLSRHSRRPPLTGPGAEITLNESGRKAIEVARWASRRGHRTQIAREDLLWGLLADASSESVRILRRGQVDLGRLWADLRRWHQSAWSA
jgi:hypothetical protein